MSEWSCYEAGAETYAAAGVDDPVWRQRHRTSFSGLLRGSVVADLGCGPGYDLAAFAALGLQTVGVDGSAAMLRIAATNSPSSQLFNHDLRLPLELQVHGLWSMFALLHVPEPDLVTCFRAWRQSIARDGPLMLGLVESDRLQTRESSGWLGQPTSCVFHYHRSAHPRSIVEHRVEDHQYHARYSRMLPRRPLRRTETKRLRDQCAGGVILRTKHRRPRPCQPNARPTGRHPTPIRQPLTNLP